MFIEYCSISVHLQSVGREVNMAEKKTAVVNVEGKRLVILCVEVNVSLHRTQ
jgi:hypothetical protein